MTTKPKKASAKISESKKESAARPTIKKINRIPFNFRISAGHLERANALAQRKGVTVSVIAQQAIAEYLEKEGA